MSIKIKDRKIPPPDKRALERMVKDSNAKMVIVRSTRTGKEHYAKQGYARRLAKSGEYKIVGEKK